MELHRRHIERLERCRATVADSELPGSDDLVVTAWPLYEQLIRLVAEDNAVADTLYHLRRALDCGAVTLDMYLKVCFGCGLPRGVYVRWSEQGFICAERPRAVPAAIHGQSTHHEGPGGSWPAFNIKWPDYMLCCKCTRLTIYLTCLEVRVSSLNDGIPLMKLK